jgi:hypothetical protein
MLHALQSILSGSLALICAKGMILLERTANLAVIDPFSAPQLAQKVHDLSRMFHISVRTMLL